MSLKRFCDNCGDEIAGRDYQEITITFTDKSRSYTEEKNVKYDLCGESCTREKMNSFLTEMYKDKW